MIEALLLIFFSMTMAEQQYVAEAACTVQHDVVDTYVSRDSEVINVFKDGTSIGYPLEITGGSPTVYDPAGNIVNYSTIAN